MPGMASCHEQGKLYTSMCVANPLLAKACNVAKRMLLIRSLINSIVTSLDLPGSLRCEPSAAIADEKNIWHLTCKQATPMTRQAGRSKVGGGGWGLEPGFNPVPGAERKPKVVPQSLCREIFAGRAGELQLRQSTLRVCMSVGPRVVCCGL